MAPHTAGRGAAGDAAPGSVQRRMPRGVRPTARIRRRWAAATESDVVALQADGLGHEAPFHQVAEDPAPAQKPTTRSSSAKTTGPRAAPSSPSGSENEGNGADRREGETDPLREALRGPATRTGSPRRGDDLRGEPTEGVERARSRPQREADGEHGDEPRPSGGEGEPGDQHDEAGDDPGGLLVDDLGEPEALRMAAITRLCCGVPHAEPRSPLGRAGRRRRVEVEGHAPREHPLAAPAFWRRRATRPARRAGRALSASAGP